MVVSLANVKDQLSSAAHLPHPPPSCLLSGRGRRISPSPGGMFQDNNAVGAEAVFDQEGRQVCQGDLLPNGVVQIHGQNLCVLQPGKQPLVQGSNQTELLCAGRKELQVLNGADGLPPPPSLLALLGSADCISAVSIHTASAAPSVLAASSFS